MKNTLNLMSLSFFACTSLATLAAQDVLAYPNSSLKQSAKLLALKPAKPKEANSAESAPKLEPAKNVDKKNSKLYGQRSPEQTEDQSPNKPNNFSLPPESAPLPKVE